MPPGAPASIGRAMIRSWSQAFLDQFRLQFALVVDEVRVLGEWAFERGGYAMSLNSKAGGARICRTLASTSRFTSGNPRIPGGWLGRLEQ